MNYTEISKKTGLSISHISRVMRGHSMGSVDTMIKISKVRGVSVEELVKEIAKAKRETMKEKARDRELDSRN